MAHSRLASSAPAEDQYEDLDNYTPPAPIGYGDSVEIHYSLFSPRRLAQETENANIRNQPQLNININT